ncbi:bestrophin-2-like isoform X1 [Argiope bruennichi]|uniref:bestrophin-2-like isoform X1 n=2 Tax=Argiope bruennichi TaxID=94029 RepID=UPI0024957248|nr:bestrophin-2-like isoform X1 [Argiope bruennichi]
MTVTYSLHVSKARLCGFAKLLTRWRGSIYKLLYREMLIFVFLYYSLLVLYRFVLNDDSRVTFEKLAIYCEAFTDLIPLSFVLGFYVTIVVGRWWQQYLAIPWPDKCCMLISTYVNGADERGRMIRRTLARYLNLMAALTFQAISPAVKKRFPTIDHLVEAGLMTKEECQVYDDVLMTHGKWWVPAQWFGSVAARARREGRIKDDILFKHLLDEMHVFRGNCGLLFSFDWISIPLVYTQVVTLAIYTYFIATVMGRQYLDPKKGYPGYEIDLYVPVFTLLQFFFYMGWLKVAEQLINPFGEDDDDFELNWCLDRNLQLSYNVVDVMHQSNPRLVKDLFWDEVEPQLPYTRSSFNLRTQPHLGSAMDLDVNLEESEFITMETIMEEDKEENNYTSPPRTPAFDQTGHFNFPTDTPTRRTSTCSIDTDNTSLSRFRLPDFPGRLVNMILGSNRELSHSTDSMKDAHMNGINTPFILKSPCHRRRSCAEPSPLALSDDRTSAESPLLTPAFQQEKDSESNKEGLLSTEQPIVFQDKPPEYCAIKIPDLSVVEEESTGSSRGSSPVHDQSQSGQQRNGNEAYQSQESLLISSDSQSTDSSSHLLKNVV